MDRTDANAPRFDPAAQGGHYESWFLRANAPEGKRAFWIRYTIFAGVGAEPIGERWAIFFDDERIVAVRDEVPIQGCSFSRAPFTVELGDARLCQDRAVGTSAVGSNTIAWDLEQSGGGTPLLLLSEGLYRGGFPKAKALVPRPHVSFRGTISVNGKEMPIDNWVGSQNHNWGSRHTDRYAWGQVASFYEDDAAFLEVSTAQINLGPFRSPWFTPLTLRVGHDEYAFGSIIRSARNQGDYGAGDDGVPSPVHFPRWEFEARSNAARITGFITAPASDFVALPYLNPPGGTKYCLNTKVAHCTLHIEESAHTRTLTSDAAAFEMLTDRAPSAIPLAF